MANGKKVVFGGLLLVSTLVVLTFMHYGNRTIGNVSGTYELMNNQKKSERPEDMDLRTHMLRKQLELVKSLVYEEVKVTSEEESSDYSSASDSILPETNSSEKDTNNIPQHPALSDDATLQKERDNMLQIKENDELEVDDDSSASESVFSETNKWPWVKNERTLVDNITVKHTAIGNETVRIQEPVTIARTKAPVFSNQKADFSLEQKMKRCVNYIKWNDRDPDAIKSLPIRSEDDPPPQPLDRVVFNRVGKCGSRSVIILLRHLAIMNKFYLIGSEVYNTTRINTEWQERIVHTLDQLKTPFLFQRHLHYVDFTSYGSTPPVYINIVRDPLARMVSQYYFKRFGDGRGKDRYTGPEEQRYQTFDDCVLNKMQECHGSKAFYIIPFFCGQEPDCKKPSQWALQQAIRNVEEKFLFVGILEEFEDTLQILEKVLPSMFNHALEYYQNPVGETASRNMSSTATLHKKKPSPQVERIMKQEMDLEYQFYNYVKNKFYKTRDTLGIKSFHKPAS